MLDFVKVFQTFSTMAKISEKDGLQYSDLIQLCISEVEGKIKSGVDFSKHEALFTQLAAACAYYRYMIMSNMTSGTINALDLSVSIDYSKQISAAKRLRDELIAMAKNYLQDDTFVFRTTE
jgi:hypothetical protein